MGLIISRIKGKHSSKDKLERIDQQIRDLENHKFTAIRRQKNFVGLLLVVSGLIYVIVAFVYYYHYLPKSPTWSQKFISASPLLVLPLVVYLLKRCLQDYYIWMIDVKEEKLRTLRQEKKKILENVMETETYKVAKELLEKYSPSTLKESKPSSAPNSPSNPPVTMSTAQSSRVRYRGSMPPMPMPMFNPIVQQRVSLNTTQSPGSPGASQFSPPNAIMPSPQMAQAMRPIINPMPRLTRPIVNPDRGTVEKLVDYIVGDGPNNRYALICSSCSGHNGMALKEEFEYISFRCCYCASFNPARKAKPLRTNSESNFQRNRNLSPLVDEPESDNDGREEQRNTSLQITEMNESSDRQSSESSQDAVNKSKDSNDDTLKLSKSSDESGGSSSPAKGEESKETKQSDDMEIHRPSESDPDCTKPDSLLTDFEEIDAKQADDKEENKLPSDIEFIDDITLADSQEGIKNET
ncbi:endoplasmic reticulum junction formation protein lunapark-B-like [Brevipalpus obovatus]|uniref:endoplasmic reticulum junction formation protein lunapark-B-like n=1 Tax=Brevipalpus obovatus TaxID=246614 RepID=UPI003D9E5B11